MVGQLSFFSAEARTPAKADLAGFLCGPGQAVSFARGTAARVYVELRDEWRHRPLKQAALGIWGMLDDSGVGRAFGGAVAVMD